jgi:DNA gyrase subunit A
MALRRLTGLEQDSLRKEAEDLRQERARLRHLLDERPALLDAMVAEFKAIKKHFATPRSTRLVEGGDELVAQRTAAQRPNSELLRQRALDGLSKDGRLLIQADRWPGEGGGAATAGAPAPRRTGTTWGTPRSGQADHAGGAAAGGIGLHRRGPCGVAAVGVRWPATRTPGDLPAGGDERGTGVQLLVMPQDPAEPTVGLLSSDGR